MKRPDKRQARNRLVFVNEIIRELQRLRHLAKVGNMTGLHDHLCSALKSADGARRNTERFTEAAK